MIDPFKITNFNRTEAELEEFLLFCICVAGKGAEQQAKKLSEFLFASTVIGTMTPFEWINHLNKLGTWMLNHPLTRCLQIHKLGQYTRLQHAFTEVAKLKNLNNISVEELENIKGIGPKTARFFVMHSRPNQQFAVLDTHILKYLKSHGIAAPKSTPTKNKYLQLEQIFLDIVKKSGKSVAEFDLEVWSSYAKK